MTVGIRHADHVASSPQTFALTSPTGSGRSVGIVRSRIQDTEFSFLDLWDWNELFSLLSILF
jgi:hypothetical protein